MCEIPSPCFNAVFTSFSARSQLTSAVKSQALVSTRYLQAFCSITAHFRQILPGSGGRSSDLEPSPPPPLTLHHPLPLPLPLPIPPPLLPPSPLAGAEGPPCSGREVWGWAPPSPLAELVLRVGVGRLGPSLFWGRWWLGTGLGQGCMVSGSGVRGRCAGPRAFKIFKNL